MRSCVPQLTAVRIVRAFTFAVAVGMAGMGCVGTPGFPAPISVHAEGEDSVLSFDTDGDRLPDFWQYQGPDGRKYALDFSSRSEDAEQRIRLDQISADDCPHFIIVLDGVPFELVDELYREGWSCGECGNNELLRVRSGQVDAGGLQIRFTVQAPTWFWHIPR